MTIDFSKLSPRAIVKLRPDRKYEFGSERDLPPLTDEDKRVLDAVANDLVRRAEKALGI